MPTHISFVFVFGFYGLYLASLRGQFEIWQKTRETGGVTRGKKPQARTWTQGRCNEDKVSVHGMLALPTELNSNLENIIF